jgi:hypothetical protein
VGVSGLADTTMTGLNPPFLARAKLVSLVLDAVLRAQRIRHVGGIPGIRSLLIEARNRQITLRRI